MPINTRFFQDRLADIRLSQRQAARRLGLDPAAVSLMFRGKRRMQLTEAAAISRLLGVPMDEVLKHAGISSPGMKQDIEVRGVPLVYWLDGHGELHALDAGETVELRAVLPDDTIAAQCRTAMTAMEHMDHWILAFQSPQNGIHPEAVGKYCVMRLAGGMMTVGYLRPGYSQGKYAIHRGGSTTEAAVEWATPVLLIRP